MNQARHELKLADELSPKCGIAQRAGYILLPNAVQKLIASHNQLGIGNYGARIKCASIVERIVRQQLELRLGCQHVRSNPQFA
jgi:hypothetical protein